MPRLSRHRKLEQKGISSGCAFFSRFIEQTETWNDKKRKDPCNFTYRTRTYAHLRRAKEINDQGVSALAFSLSRGKRNGGIKRKLCLVLLLWSDNSEIIKKEKRMNHLSDGVLFARSKKKTKRRKSLLPSWRFTFIRKRGSVSFPRLFPLLFL